MYVHINEDDLVKTPVDEVSRTICLLLHAHLTNAVIRKMLNLSCEDVFKSLSDYIMFVNILSVRFLHGEC